MSLYIKNYNVELNKMKYIYTYVLRLLLNTADTIHLDSSRLRQFDNLNNKTYQFQDWPGGEQHLLPSACVFFLI